jgi:signal transduction histidine kinase
MELVATVQALLRARQMERMLREKNQELQRLVQAMHGMHAGPRQTSRALEESSRGVRALHAELDERAEHLGRLHALQTRCLIDLSHEFRTPLNSILTLSRFLLERTDGTLTTEQERQALFIQRAAETLLTLVNNTLEMVRTETGQRPVRPETFTVDDLLSTLRGMFMPLLDNPNVALVLEEPRDIPPFHTDQGKVLQILRNLICNALRFTERGEARVSAALALEGQAVEFRVADTGIGIALQDHEHIFEKFFQIRRPGQEQGKGVGLGLALVRELAQLLNGRITLQSQPGIGSVFSVVIPLVYAQISDA